MPTKGGVFEMAKHHARVVELRAGGDSLRQIANITGYDHSTVWGILRKHLAEVGPSREDAEKIRSMLFAEHEAVKEHLVPFVFAEDDNGNPSPLDPAALAHHLARGKEQAELFHLHGKQDDVTHHEGDASPSADAKAERTRVLVEFMHEKGLDGPPVDVIDVASRLATEGHSLWSAVLEFPRPEDGEEQDQFLVDGFSRKNGDL